MIGLDEVYAPNDLGQRCQVVIRVEILVLRQELDLQKGDSKFVTVILTRSIATDRD
jgi:hypothetical protein